ncbi:hypothetical protein HYT58_02765 [Candidatus Woesearchaeota archaeon]|nr:hypothetical protein [Candidatus Woesearchaeota archaeon]
MGLRKYLFPTFDEVESKYNLDTDKTMLKTSLLWARTLGLGIALLVGSCGAFTNNYVYSEGTRTGMLNKVSKKGLIWKTYECQMALEGVSSGGGNIAANVWDFSLDNSDPNVEKLAGELEEALKSDKKVRVEYDERLITWPWRSGTGYLVRKIEPIKQ